MYQPVACLPIAFLRLPRSIGNPGAERRTTALCLVYRLPWLACASRPGLRRLRSSVRQLLRFRRQGVSFSSQAALCCKNRYRVRDLATQLGRCGCYTPDNLRSEVKSPEWGHP